MLREEDKREVRERLSALREPVKLVYFTQMLAGACRFCVETERLLKDVASLSDRITLETRNFVSDAEEARRYGVDKIPATVLIGEKDSGLRFYGMPSGYEFMTFLETLLRLSRRDSGLSEESRKALKGLDRPVHLQVFVTPTCPYCPQSAILGYGLAMESELITCDVVEISEFPHLGQKYGVMGVPKTVINDSDGLEGAVPEAVLVSRIMKTDKIDPKSE
ncbi:MAG: thioredoxin family protein [bacterium]|nr:thioredoxin family protein [bacterium]